MVSVTIKQHVYFLSLVQVSSKCYRSQYAHHHFDQKTKVYLQQLQLVAVARVHDGKARGEVVFEALTSRHRIFDREITQRQDVALHGYPHIVGASAKVKFTHDEHSVVPVMDSENELIIIIIIAVISIAPYVTDKSEHIALYTINISVYIIIIMYIDHALINP